MERSPSPFAPAAKRKRRLVEVYIHDMSTSWQFCYLSFSLFSLFLSFYFSWGTDWQSNWNGWWHRWMPELLLNLASILQNEIMVLWLWEANIVFNLICLCNR